MFYPETSTNTAYQVLARNQNSALVLHTLRNNGAMSRARLAARLGLNRSTVSSIVRDLATYHMVKETRLHRVSVGRPGMLLELDAQGGCAVGVDFNVDFITVVLTDFRGNQLWRRRVQPEAGHAQELLIPQAESLVREALEAGQAQSLRPLGIGVGLPGLVDVSRGFLRFAPNLHWQEVPLGDRWSRSFELPVFVENEANTAALGEYFLGSRPGVRDLVYLSCGAGLGGGIILDGRLFRGRQGNAGEIGHMKIRPDGERCGCGQCGCWETLVGTHAVERRAAGALDRAGRGAGPPAFGQVIAGAAQGDPVFLEVVRELGVHLGLGIANLANILNPELVVLGGELAGAGDLLLSAVRDTVRVHALDLVQENLQIAVSSHGPDAGVLGAASLVLDAVMREPLLSMRN